MINLIRSDLGHWSLSNIGDHGWVTCALFIAMVAACAFTQDAPKIRPVKASAITAIYAAVVLLVAGARHWTPWHGYEVYGTLTTWRVATVAVGYAVGLIFLWGLAVKKNTSREPLGDYDGLPLIIPVIIVCVGAFNGAPPADVHHPHLRVCATANNPDPAPIAGPCPAGAR
jgi:hypothetical protein